MNIGFLNALPRHYYRWMTIPSLAIAGLLTYLTVSYFIHGAEEMETDPFLKTLAAIMVIVLVSSELIAGWMASMLSGQKFAVWCWTLKSYAGFIFLIELVMICLVQISSMLSADMSLAKLGAEATILQNRIERIEASVNTKRQTAQLQLQKAHDPYELKLAARSSQQATDEEQQTKPLYEELAKVKEKIKPTMTTTLDTVGNILGFNLGLAFSIGLVVARSFGMSMGALMFSMMSGALWRRGSVVVADDKSPVVAPAAAAPAVPNFGTPAPAPIMSFKAPSPAPAAVLMPSWFERLAKWKQAAIVPATVGAASGVSAKPPELPEPPQARVEYSVKLTQQVPKLERHDAAAPAAPAPSPAPAESSTAPAAEHEIVLNPARLDEHEMPAAAPAAAPEPALQASAQAPVAEAEIVLDPAQLAAPAAAPEPAASAQAPAAEPEKAAEVVLNRARKPAKKLGTQVDTGVGEHDGYRYRRLKEAVLGGLKPTVASLIVADVPCSGEVARRYQAEMLEQGVLVRKGNRYMLAPKHAAKLTKAKAKAESAQFSLIED